MIFKVYYYIRGSKECGYYEGIDKYDAIDTWKRYMKRFRLQPSDYSCIRTEDVAQEPGIIAQAHTKESVSRP